MKKLNFAILGAGNIAQDMAATVRQMDCVAPYAIGARELARAEAFAACHGFERAYGSYEEVLADPAVDLVYIATPHSHHAEQMLACLDAGKHVLCEKSFTKTAAQARAVFARAREKGLLATEAIWPRYMPMAETIRAFAQSGRIGKIHSLTCNLGYPVSHVARVKDPALAGGALLDVGVYTMHFASLLFGSEGVKEITSCALMSEKGVDMQGTAALTYEDGRIASLLFTVLAQTDRIGALHGETGHAIVENINNFESLKIYNDDHKLVEQIVRPAQLTGFEYEVQSAVDAIRRGAVECPEVPHAETVRIMEWMDRIRHGWGMWYPGEKEG